MPGNGFAKQRFKCCHCPRRFNNVDFNGASTCVPRHLGRPEETQNQERGERDHDESLDFVCPALPLKRWRIKGWLHLCHFQTEEERRVDEISADKRTIHSVVSSSKRIIALERSLLINPFVTNLQPTLAISSNLRMGKFPCKHRLSSTLRGSKDALPNENKGARNTALTPGMT